VDHQNELKEYLRSHLEQDFSAAELVEHLRAAGWQDDHIQPALQWATAAHVSPPPALNDIPPAVVQQAATHPHMPETKARIKTLPLLIAGVFVFILLLGGGLFLILHKAETPQQLFSKTVEKSLQTGTFRQKYVEKKDSLGTITTDYQTDFSDPKSPKISGTIELNADLSQQTGINGTLTLKQDVIAIEDKVYLKTTAFSLSGIDDSIKSQILTLRTDPSETVEDILRKSYDIGEVNTWQSYDLKDFDTFSAGASLSLSRIIAIAVSGFNTVLGQYIIGNVSSQAPDTAQKLLNSGSYTPHYDQSKKVTDNGASYTSIPLDISDSKVIDFNKNLAKTLGLEQREVNIITQSPANDLGKVSVQINPKTHLPHKISDENSQRSVEYSDFGARYNIKAPI